MNAFRFSFKARRSRRDGFSLAELMFSMTILTMVMAALMLAMVNILRREDVLSNRMDMVGDGQRLASFLRTSTRLSSITDMVMYPDESPHIALSYPVPGTGADSDSMEENGRLVWGETLMVHAWPVDKPTELRMTRFRPRDNNLSANQREQQLKDVTLDGDGSNAFNGTNSDTRTLADLQPEFSFTTDGGSYNFYAPELTRERNVALGGVRLNSGNNTVTFRVKDKSPGSDGHGLKIDRLRISPAGLALEAESLLPAASQSGAAAGAEEKTPSNWSDRRLLSFPAGSAGAEVNLTYFNDTWHETLFLSGGDLEDCKTTMGTEAGDVGTRLVLSGRDPAWIASLQAPGDGVGFDNHKAFGTAMRVVVKGSLSTPVNYILNAGDGCTVMFKATNHSEKSLRISDAFIAEAADHVTPGPDIRSESSVRLEFGSPESSEYAVHIPSGGVAKTVPADFPIDPEKSYVISYKVAAVTTSEGNPWHFKDEGSPTGTWILPASSYPGVNDLVALNWSARPDLQTAPGIVGVEGIDTTYANQGVYTSRIVDTRLEAPKYHDLDWNGVFPENTSLGLRMRTGDKPDLGDAPLWENVGESYSPGELGITGGRYVQIRVRLERDKILDTTPELRHFTLRWWGDPAYVDFGGDFYRYSSGGIAEVLVNDVPPSSTLRAELRLTAERKTKENKPDTWRLVVESTPRN